MKTAIGKQQVWASGWPLLALRLVIGFGFAAHGYAKLQRGPEHFAEILSAIGIFAPLLTAWLSTLIELGGGVMLMLGVFVSPLCVPLAVVMLTAMFSVHLPYGFLSVKLRAFSASGAQFGPVGYELNLVYLASLLVLAVSPPIRVSVDGWLRGRRSARSS